MYVRYIVYLYASAHDAVVIFCVVVRNLMYGFGDDRNPANDTVNVMEEILIEYIIDVVRIFILPVAICCEFEAHMSI